MKLRNKKTGEIFDYREDIMPFGLGSPLPKSLAELCENWEDVDGTNDTNIPLIKDPKIRKAVRAWAEANKATIIRCYQNTRASGFSYENLELGVCTNISFIGDGIIDKRLNNNSYTITELCGEEEE